MNGIVLRMGMLSAAVIAGTVLPACNATQIATVSKDSTYDPAAMRRVLVIAVVKTDRIQKMLEDAFVRQLQKRGREATASYTMVPHDRTLEPDAWKKLIADYGWDAVLVSRLTDSQVVEKETGAKVLQSDAYGAAYRYYVYQPSSYIRDETDVMETRVFDMTADREVFFAKTKTRIAHGGDPEVQIRRFVDTLTRAARR